MNQEVITLSSSDEEDVQLPKAKRIRRIKPTPVPVTDKVLRDIFQKVDMDQETREELAKSDLSKVCENIIILSESDEENETVTTNEAQKTTQKPKTNRVAISARKSSKLTESRPKTFKAFKTTLIPKTSKTLKTHETIVIEAPKCFRAKTAVTETVESSTRETIEVPVEPVKTVALAESVPMEVSNSAEETKTLDLLRPLPVESKENQEKEKSLTNGNLKHLVTEEILECSYTETLDQKDDIKIFLAACTKSIAGSKFKDLRLKYPKLEQQYLKYQTKNNLEVDDELVELLKLNTAKAAQSSWDAVIAFDAVLELLTEKNSDVPILPENRKKVKILVRTCKKLIRKIKQLEQTDVAWDDDGNSSYLQEDRYKARLMKVFNLYCKYTKTNPRAGRIMYKKVNFSSSSYDEINAAINNKYRDNSVVPDYTDIEKLIRRTCAESELNLSDNKIIAESQMCFKTLGELLKKRRQNDLYVCHHHHIKDGGNDPASDDPQLESNLKRSEIEGAKKMEEIYEHFARKQTEGVNVDEVEASEDSDESAREKNQSNSDSESD